ncbi:hypothetical protein ACPV4B_07565 [Vibrio parahaemolyticus]|uniref:hypothetical protein n=1 Tax=Vibrio mediterranei TaxID=689 RepID=UPI0040690971
MKMMLSFLAGVLLAISSMTYAGPSSGKIGFLVDCQLNGEVVTMPMTACRSKGGVAK